MFEMHVWTHLRSLDPGSQMSNARTRLLNPIQIPIEYEITLKADFYLSGVKMNNWICIGTIAFSMAKNNMES